MAAGAAAAVAWGLPAAAEGEAEERTAITRRRWVGLRALATMEAGVGAEVRRERGMAMAVGAGAALERARGREFASARLRHVKG